jgi:hypothetical protein
MPPKIRKRWIHKAFGELKAKVDSGAFEEPGMLPPLACMDERADNCERLDVAIPLPQPPCAEEHKAPEENPPPASSFARMSLLSPIVSSVSLRSDVHNEAVDSNVVDGGASADGEQIEVTLHSPSPLPAQHTEL